MNAFAKLKEKAGSIANIQAAVQKTSNSYSNDLDGISWKLETDKSGNGHAVIRFLPASEGEESPFVRMYSHGFKSKTNEKSWFIENCNTTIGGSCAVCDDVSDLYGTGIESDKKVAGDRKRKQSFYSNIIVLSDPKNPQNEYANCGKVFVFRYGKKIFDMITECINPTYDGETAYDPFDLWAGANFKFKAKKVENFPNYDSSSFDNPSELFGGDNAKLEDLYNKQHKLQTIIAPEKFKSEEEVAAKYAKFVGVTKPVTASTANDELPFGNSSKPTFSKPNVDDFDDLDIPSLLADID